MIIFPIHPHAVFVFVYITGNVYQEVINPSNPTDDVSENIIPEVPNQFEDT